MVFSYKSFLIILCIFCTGCASRGTVWERVDNRLIITKKWIVKGTQKTRHGDFEVDTKFEPIKDVVSLNAIRGD